VFDCLCRFILRPFRDVEVKPSMRIAEASHMHACCLRTDEMLVEDQRRSNDCVRSEVLKHDMKFLSTTNGMLFFISNRHTGVCQSATSTR
jgi:hypothetical protein